MEDIFQGWQDKKNKYIPPVRQKGFSQDVLIREYIPPLNVEPEPESAKEKIIHKKSEDETYDGGEPTVLIEPSMRIHAFLKRAKTGSMEEITKKQWIIGKSAEADYVIKDNPTVSRNHAKIQFKEDGYWLTDLGSSNHTYVDGEQILEPVRLIDGMKFRLSEDEEFEFTIRMGR